jgi:peptidoglycan/LPS O-acetylase OafA/YrhL
MNPFLSFYINILRILAATAVFTFHFGYIFHQDPFDIGHSAVVVFFVISGFVIAYTTNKKSKGYKEYIIDRLARLYSVIIPALIITFIINLIGYFVEPSRYSLSDPTSLLYYFRYVIAFFNMQQTWFFCSTIPNNTPFWSLAYEFWYYVLFGLFFYISTLRWKIISIVLCLCLIGPKIILLLPCWLIGVGAYYVAVRINQKANIVQLILFLASLVIFILLYFECIPTLFEKENLGVQPLYCSANYLNDFILAVILGINIVCSNSIHLIISNTYIVAAIDYVVNGTFVLYLIHVPILVFIEIVCPAIYWDGSQLFFIGIGLYIVLIFAGNYIENKRFWFKNMLKKFYNNKAESQV